jgi:hypothetical protein
MLAFAVVALMLLVVALAAGWLLVLWLIVRRAILSVPIAAYIGLDVWLGAHNAQAKVIYALLLLGLWRVVHRPSFERAVGRRLRSSWRRLWVYDRRWHRTMVLLGLGRRYGLCHHVPRIRSVTSVPGTDRVVRLVAGQCTEDVERAAPRLAQSFGVRSCLVTENRPGRLVLLLAACDRPWWKSRAWLRAHDTRRSESRFPRCTARLMVRT